MSGHKTRIAVLISGSGSNLQALIEAAKAPEYPAQIALVFSNKLQAYGLNRAQAAGITTVAISHKDYATRADYEREIQKILEEHKIDFVCLAGFMRVLDDAFVRQWEGRMINIHPSLLPKYKGLNTHQRAIDAGDDKAGCTVHLVVTELDAGPVLAQAEVPILPNDTAETLAARVLEQEHKIYPKALAALVQK